MAGWFPTCRCNTCLTMPLTARKRRSHCPRCTTVGKRVMPDLTIHARPEAVGLSSQRLAHIDKWREKLLSDGKLAGLMTLVARRGEVAHWGVSGFADKERERPMAPDTIFRIYSMTKAITSVALMMLYEEGRFQLDDPISRYLPAFAGSR